MAHERIRELLSPRTLAGPLGFVLCMILLASAPGIARAQAGADSLLLQWTATGDDGSLGTAAQYELRYSTSPLDPTNFAQGTLVTGVPQPAVASTPQSVRLRGLSRGLSYWFAVRAQDAAGNWSPLSNVLRWDWIDSAPLLAPSTLQASVQQSATSVRIYWRPNSEPGLIGYFVYRSVHLAGVWIRLNNVPTPQPSWVDNKLPPDANGALDYCVTAVDAGLEESARSAVIAVRLTTSPTSATTAAFDLALDPPYPNPSRLAESARLPISLPSAAGAVRLEIRDENDLLVRRIDVSDRAGARGQVAWDGRNDTGQLCAPGVYRAWLIRGESKRMVRVARVP